MVSARLVVLEGESRAPEFELFDADTLGRDVDAGISDPEVSREHVRLVSVAGHPFLEDLGSINGTFVNGFPISRTPLRVRDRVVLGGTVLVVAELHSDASAPTVIRSTLGGVAGLAQPDPEGFTSDPRRSRALVILAIANFMVLLDNTVVTVALPSIQSDLKLSSSSLEWVVSGYALAFAVFLLTGGKLADLVGRRRIFIIGLAVFTVSSLACGLAPNALVLVGSRVIQGFGAALMLPATLAIIPAIFPLDERAMAVGIWTGSSGLGIALGPLVGGALTESLSWNWIFFINIPIGLIGLVLAPRIVAESRDLSATRSLDIPGVLTSTVALAAVTVALIEAPSKGWTSPIIIGLFVASVVALVAFVIVERTGTAPLLDLRLFRNGAFAGSNLVAVFVGIAMLSVLVFISVFLQRALGYSAFEAGVTFLPMTLLIIILAPISAGLSEKLGPRPFLVGGLTVMALGLFLLSQLPSGAGFYDVVWRLAVSGVGIGCVLAPMTDAALGSAPVDKSGVASGLINMCRQLGGAIGIAVSGAIIMSGQERALKAGIDPSTAFLEGLSDALLVGMGIALFGAVVAAALIRGIRLESSEAGGPQRAERIAVG